MRVWCGIPGDPPRVVVIGDDGEARLLLDRETGRPDLFGWSGKADPRASLLAKAIMFDALGHAGLEFATRFRWREIIKWKPERPWSVNEEEIQTSVASMKEIEQLTAGDRARVALMPPTIGVEGGADIVWTKAPAITRNPNITKEST